MNTETKKQLNDLYLTFKAKSNDKNESEAVREHNEVKLVLIGQLSSTLKKEAYKSDFMKKLAIESFGELCQEIKTVKQLERKTYIVSRVKVKTPKPFNVGVSPYLKVLLLNEEFVFNHL